MTKQKNAIVGKEWNGMIDVKSSSYLTQKEMICALLFSFKTRVGNMIYYMVYDHVIYQIF